MITDQERTGFWEKCGLEILENSWVEDHYEPDGRWYDSNGHLFVGDFLFGIPAIDLNNLFQIAVPFLKEDNEEWWDILVEWAKGITGNYEKDTETLLRVLQEAMKC